MKRGSVLFLVVLGLAAVASAEPNDVAGLDPNSVVVDIKDAKVPDVNDLLLLGAGNPNLVTDPNEIYASILVIRDNAANDVNAANSTNGSGSGTNEPPAETSGDSNTPSAYDDSNIHSVYDIINPVRLTANNTNVFQSLSMGARDALPTLSSVTTNPTSPNSSDTVSVTFAGRKGANYVVDHVDVSVQSGMITVNVTWRRDGSTDGPVVDYSQTQSLGKLNPGTYTLQLKNCYNGQSCASTMKFIRVTASSTSASNGSLWDWLTSHTSSSTQSPFANWPAFSQLW
jgi:hypothetical protein